MPMFDFKCEDCGFKREHFVYAGPAIDKKCHKCGSARYTRQLGRFKVSVEYSNSREHMENVIQPGVNELYAQIGRETLDEDAGTLENLFGTEVIKESIIEKDD